MKQKNIIILIFLLSISTLAFSQNTDSLLVSLPDYSTTIFKEFQNISTTNTSLSNIIQLFYQKRYNLFLKELRYFNQQNPNSTHQDALTLLQGIASLKENQISNAFCHLISLTNNSNLEIRHQSLLYLYQNEIIQSNLNRARDFLRIIHEALPGTPHKEIAHLKLLYIAFKQENYRHSRILSQSFMELYPNSDYLNEMHYFIALNDYALGNPSRARAYALKILETQNYIPLQLLLSEILIQENNLSQALEYLLPITKVPNYYQDEALYKAAIINKLNQDYTTAHQLLSQIVNYHQTSSYYERADKELANINIILKNYDDALAYFLRESSYTGTRKAYALLKITEIHFLRKNTPAVLRTGKRIQRTFPYSTFANESLYWIGRSYLQEKQFEKSIEVFDTYLLREPTNLKKDEITIFLGHAYANLDNHSQARGYFHKIINDSKNDQLKRQALLALGQSYTKTEPRRSLEYFDRVWKTWNNTTETEQSLYYSAAVRYNLRQNQDSLKQFKQLINTFPESSFYPDALLAIAKLEFKAENFENILNIDTLPINKQNQEVIAEFKELQGHSLFRTGQYNEALLLFQESLKITTNASRKTDLILAEASTLRSLGRHKEAVQNYERYINTLKTDNSINNIEELLWSEIVFSYLEIQDTGKAERNILYIEQQFPNSSYLTDIYFKLADGYFGKENYRKAAEYYQKTRLSSKQSSIMSDALLREAWSREYTRDFKTQEIFELFLSQYPKHFGVPDISIRLAGLIRKQDPKRSHDLMVRLIKDYPDSLEAEKARLYFVERFSMKNSTEDFYQAISEAIDIRLKSKFLFKLATKFKNENDLDKAIELYKEIHQNKDITHGAESLLEAAKIFMQKKQYQDSLKLAINVIAQYEDKYYAQALDLIIQNYLFLEDTNNAEKFRLRLIEQYPNSTESRKWTNTLL